MASSWSITINQHDGVITFTPDMEPPATVGQPLGVNNGDNVTWNNRTNLEITLKSYPENPESESVFLCDPIPPGGVSNPIFNVKGTVKYSRVLQGERVGPDAWIVVV